MNSTLALFTARADEEPVRRLADLDDSAPLSGPVLLALVDGDAVAAMSLSDGQVVADPFRPTDDVVTLLEVRAAQLSARRERRLSPRSRFARRGLGRVPRLRVA